MTQHADQQVAVGRRAGDRRAGQPGRQPANRGRPGRRPGDHLGEHRVVVRGDDAARLDARVDAQRPGHRPEPDPGRRPETRSRCPGTVNACTIPPPDGRKPSAGSSAYSRASIACPAGGGGSPGSGSPCGDRQLQRDQVDAVHALGDRVLDLEPGVELQEVELSPSPHQELDRPRVDVADGLGQRGRGVQQPLSAALASRLATASPRSPWRSGAARSSPVRSAPRPCRA